jgi:penicillin-binding protein 2
MLEPPPEPPPPRKSQLLFRAAMLGSVAVAMFSLIFFRLWSLQILSGARYLAEARVNQVRQSLIQAPRGLILDRNGNLLVGNRRAIAVQLSPPDLPRSRHARAHELRRLAAVLGLPARPQRCLVGRRRLSRRTPIDCQIVRRQATLPYANVTVATDIPQAAYWYLSERQDEFPGVSEPDVYVRNYPLRTVAAHLFGTVGPITSSELRMPEFRGVPETDVVGQSGLERHYDRYLRGIDGADLIQVDALGHFTGYLSRRLPRAGDTLRLSLDLRLQQAGERALKDAIAHNPPAAAGAFVAMNPQDGQIYAMGSLPTFDPNVFASPVPVSVYEQLNAPASGYPLLNRVLASSYPTGSTFKVITATAALQSGAWSLGDTYDDSGVYSNGTGDVRHNAGGAAYGTLTLVDALRVSSDDFFYNLGRLLNADPARYPDGGGLQRWARAFGIGRPTGVDVGGEPVPDGILPSPSWRARRDRLESRCERARRIPSCGIADGRPWSVGDSENLAVGQGDLEATPLQLAVAYAAVANGGTIVRPHVGMEIDASDGTPIRKIDPRPLRRLHIDSQSLEAIRTGLREAASQPGGTSADIFGSFPEQVYGKTGTAQHPNGEADQSWYACFVPAWATDRPILVVVTVEQGGFGAQAAAPAAREILSQWFFGNRGSFVAGSSRTL